MDYKFAALSTNYFVIILFFITGSLCCHGAGEVIECSYPDLPGVQFKHAFLPACGRHDLCYRHAYCTYGTSRSACDINFLNHMHEICKQLPKSQVTACTDEADIIYDVLWIIGRFGYYRTDDCVYCEYLKPDRWLLQTGTILHETDSTWEFSIADWDGDGVLDLIGIKKSNTGTGSTEVHILSLATNQWLLQTGTILHETDSTWDFALMDYNFDQVQDVVGVKKSGTESVSTELHVLSGASGFQRWIIQTGTLLHETDASWNFLIVDWKRNGIPALVGIKKSGTDTKSTEVHILGGYPDGVVMLSVPVSVEIVDNYTIPLTPEWQPLSENSPTFNPTNEPVTVPADPQPVASSSSCFGLKYTIAFLIIHSHYLVKV